MLTPGGTYPFMAGECFQSCGSKTCEPNVCTGYIDVRDLARMHINALDSPQSAVGRKRMLIASPIDLNYGEAVRYIAEARPELKSRLNDDSKAPK